jgi:LysR family glycine cleavage system transcriptional activator
VEKNSAMTQPLSSIPSLNALRAFETAARYLSFKEAALELHVSASAVGHLVSDLEDFFGTRLFIREHRRLALTPAGQSLAPGLATAFDHLRGAVRAFQNGLQERPLTISVEPTFGLHCLLPKLESFRAQYPDIAVRIEPNHALADPRVDDVDICIRYGHGDYPGLDVDTLAEDEEIAAVCSPKLLEGKHPLRDIDDIRFHTLIDRSESRFYKLRTDWNLWFKAAGKDKIICKDRIVVNLENYAIMSALQGHGITLVNTMMVADELRTGQLVKPFDVSFRVGIGYHLVTSPWQATDQRIRAFRDWLVAVTRPDLSDGDPETSKAKTDGNKNED